MASAARYEIIFVLDDTSLVTRTREGAQVATNLMTNYPPKRAVFVMRYYPSRKAWRVFDLRRKHVVRRGPREYWQLPEASVELVDRDAAVMWAELNIHA